jgi:regulatory protein
MASRKPRRPPPPLDSGRLQELAIHYVGRFATTRAKLRTYLARKIRERGWEGAPPDLEALAERLAGLGYIDDAAYALGKSRSLTARGYGKRRLADQLRVAGVAEADSAAASEHAETEAVAAAVRFAKRRRIGPFAVRAPDPREREKAVAAMIRAGHPFRLARALADLEPGAEVDCQELSGR